MSEKNLKSLRKHERKRVREKEYFFIVKPVL